MVKVVTCESSNLNFYRMFESAVECCPELNNVIACCSIKFSPIEPIGERNAHIYVSDKNR